MGKASNFILLHVDIQLSQHHLLKRLSFPIEGSWHSCQKSIGRRHTGLFLDSVPVTHVCILMPVPHCFLSFFLSFSFLSFHFLFIYLIYLWLRWVFVAAWPFSSCDKQGLLFVAVCGLLIAVASLVAEHRL